MYLYIEDNKINQSIINQVFETVRSLVGVVDTIEAGGGWVRLEEVGGGFVKQGQFEFYF